ncbi:hypothetical protein P175DRAFT_0512308 [Aspergillus ochraceoroseus IBT 24754]|uniref:Phosphoinositide phospholipase C n=1 Tax=Aspergillus ochraceoroseus IBT 24754 TaxID=1392256 RepID=A0A2T5LMU1_9EURO|nr:uncharacterized protein P175DRAFT_0512308 [Aspergillus ochraceoroseus IBT 24754]PTU17594.1 hypothetical protein P175DRAFT_0512308 [Aspergillus ochraceoroseus IBT 24754]
MATVNELTEHAAHISLNSSSEAIPAFSPSFKTHLDQVYGSLTSSKQNLLKDIQHESPDQTLSGDPLSSLAAFHAYMASPAASAMRPANPPDTSAPITDYFISSSHNTYLTGNQLYSNAAASAYTHVLLSGGRCVEIDPRVLHGRTLTRSTTFRKVCHAIRDSAFVTSDLPVIVSLEVHACLEQQGAMVEIMEETFKDMLIQVTPEMEAMETPPPLADLKRKILVKVKWVPATSGDQDEVDDHPDDLEPLSHTTSANTTASARPKKSSKILHALSRHAIFTKGFSFKQFTQPEAKIPGHVFSLSEKAARQDDVKFENAFFEHNRKFFMRIYPSGLRVNSSNLDPTFFWRRGAQIVALNWQNSDKGMMLNRGMFAGEHGWVLKPQGFRSTEPESAPIPRRKLDLTIEFLAGQDIALPPGDKSEKGFHPYVACYLHVETPQDSPAGSGGESSTDSEKSSYKRVIKSSSGANPEFNSQKIQFPPLLGIVEELTFVRFKVKDDEIGRDSLAAWACIRLDRLREGYRVIRLCKCDGSESGGHLLVRVTKNISEI